MPIYEYRCGGCGAVRVVFVQGYADPEGLVCESCGGTELKRIISRVNYHGSQADRLATYDPRQGRDDGFYRDSRNIGLHAERMLKQAGVEPSEDFKRKLDRVRTNPASVIKDYEP